MRRFTVAFVLSILLIGIGPASSAEVSVHRALNMTLPDVRFSNINVGDAIDFLRDVSGTNIHVNWRALEEAGIGKDTTINVRLRSVQFRKVLQLVISEAGHGNLLTYYVDGNIIEVTTRELADRELFTKVYPVDDLIMEVPDFEPPQFQITAPPTGRGGGGGGQPLFQTNATAGGQVTTRAQRADALIATIQSIIKPEIWTVNGGTAAIRFLNGSLIVTAPRSVHEALGGFVD